MLRKTGILTRPNLSTPPVLRSVEACGSSCGFCTSRSFWNDAPRKGGLATLLKTMIRPGQGREACTADSSLSGREPPSTRRCRSLCPVSLPSSLVLRPLVDSYSAPPSDWLLNLTHAQKFTAASASALEPGQRRRPRAWTVVAAPAAAVILSLLVSVPASTGLRGIH